MTKLHQSGFTLIELLVVVALIGVLTGLLANMVGIRERGADTKVKNDLNQLKRRYGCITTITRHIPLVAELVWMCCQ